MSNHEISVTSSRGLLQSCRWYVNCTCGWDIHRAVRDGDARMNDGYFGRATEADARALGDIHILKATTTMPRRMQANPKYSPFGHGREHDGPFGHGREHDESDACAIKPACIPVAPKPAVIIDGVRVGDDATVEVHTCGDDDCYDDGCYHDTAPGTVRYTAVVPPPKPTFFEEGKTYTKHSRWTFKVEAVRDGVAFGYLAGDPYGDRWAIRNVYDWTSGWEEA